MKNEPLPITYSYWDGTGHRRKVVVRKGDTISQFLKAVKLQLSEEFREIRQGTFAGSLIVLYNPRVLHKVIVRKGDTISLIFKAVKLQLSEEFRGVRRGSLCAIHPMHFTRTAPFRISLDCMLHTSIACWRSSWFDHQRYLAFEQLCCMQQPMSNFFDLLLL